MSYFTERITQITENDVICGRKGIALKHPGNLAYRKLVALNKELYATCMKNEKLRISKSIVAAMREAGGRFLEREDGKTSFSLDEKDEHGNPVTYTDLGDKRAIEKTSQALREGQPKLLKKLAQKHRQVQTAALSQTHQYQHAVTRTISPISLESISRYDPFVPKHVFQQGVVQQTVMPPSSPTLLPQLSQVEKDLLLLNFLSR